VGIDRAREGGLEGGRTISCNGGLERGRTTSCKGGLKRNCTIGVEDFVPVAATPLCRALGQSINIPVLR
jgi:hypothetical protein